MRHMLKVLADVDLSVLDRLYEVPTDALNTARDILARGDDSELSLMISRLAMRNAQLLSALLELRNQIDGVTRERHAQTEALRGFLRAVSPIHEVAQRLADDGDSASEPQPWLWLGCPDATLVPQG